MSARRRNPIQPRRLLCCFPVGVLLACQAPDQLPRVSKRNPALDTTVATHVASTAPPAGDLAAGARVINLFFVPSAIDSALLRTILPEVALLPHGPVLSDSMRPPELYTFGERTSAPRYLLVARQPRFSDGTGEHWGIAYYVIDPAQPGRLLSPPLDMKDAEYNVVEEVADVDGDGRPDVVYCSGFEGEEEPPVRRVATIIDDHWRKLNRPKSRRASCSGLRSPPVYVLRLKFVT